MRKILSKIPAENHTSTAIFPSRKESGCETFGNTYLISVPLILEALRLNTETLPSASTHLPRRRIWTESCTRSFQSCRRATGTPTRLSSSRPAVRTHRLTLPAAPPAGTQNLARPAAGQRARWTSGQSQNFIVLTRRELKMLQVWVTGSTRRLKWTRQWKGQHWSQIKACPAVDMWIVSSG